MTQLQALYEGLWVRKHRLAGFDEARRAIVGPGGLR